MPRPHSAEAESAVAGHFIAAVRELLGSGGDPARRRKLLRALRHPLNCSRCAAACHVFEASGRDERFRPGARAGIVRRLYFKYVKNGGRLSTWRHGDAELNWDLVAELVQMAYGCNLCGRCAQSCPSSDHALVARELRAILHQAGILARQKGSSDVAWLRDRIAATDEQTSRRAGVEVRTPWDLVNADVLLVQPASAIADWPESVGALGLILTLAGIKWTMSSELIADDIGDAFEPDATQPADLLRRSIRVARGLKAQKIAIGESGNVFRALCAVDARNGESDVQRESVVTLLRDVVRSGGLKFDPVRNDFPVTLHDPCKLARHGVVEPQREVLRRLCPQFREMNPWAEHNYCCGGCGGPGQAAVDRAWRVQVAGRKKIDQVLDAFSECLDDPDTRKYVCAPCGNCKAQLRDLLAEHAPWEKHRILCGGLAELVANAMAEVQPGFLQWE